MERRVPAHCQLCLNVGIINLTCLVSFSLLLSSEIPPRIWILICLPPFIQYLWSTYCVSGTVVDTVVTACGCQGMSSIGWLNCLRFKFRNSIFLRHKIDISATICLNPCLFVLSAEIGQDLLYNLEDKPQHYLLLIFDMLSFISDS